MSQSHFKQHLAAWGPPRVVQLKHFGPWSRMLIWKYPLSSRTEILEEGGASSVTMVFQLHLTLAHQLALVLVTGTTLLTALLPLGAFTLGGGSDSENDPLTSNLIFSILFTRFVPACFLPSRNALAFFCSPGDRRC